MAGYKLTPLADHKLDQLYEYSLENFGLLQAREYYQSLTETFDLIASHPGKGRRFRHVRRHEHGNHVIFYRDLKSHVLIIDFLHRVEDADWLDF